MQGPERVILAMLCEELESLRAEGAHQPEPRRELLARIETEARARRPILHLVTQLLGASQQETRQMIASGLPGFSGGRADEESFGCPDQACDRVCVPPPAGPPPHCLLIDTPMQRR